jgi:hypothetical protein
MIHGHLCLIFQNNIQMKKKQYFILVLFYIILPNLLHFHFIAHYYRLLGTEGNYCGVEIFYFIPYILFNCVMGVYLIYKKGIYGFWGEYNMYVYFFIVGFVLFFILGQHPYMDYYSN